MVLILCKCCTTVVVHKREPYMYTQESPIYKQKRAIYVHSRGSHIHTKESPMYKQQTVRQLYGTFHYSENTTSPNSTKSKNSESLNLYCEIGVSGFGGFRECRILSGIFHMWDYMSISQEIDMWRMFWETGLWVCVYVCVHECLLMRERDREIERKRERKG